MAMHSSRLTEDQNFSVHFDGGIKSNTVQKNKGGTGGRKALNDISNSGKPSALQPSRKHNTNNVIPIGEYLGSGISKKPQIPPLGGKPLKPQVSGRKALGDLTNSFGKQQQHKGVKKKKSIAVAEDENFPYSSIAEGCFLHNHEECIKSQKVPMDLGHFLKIIGLDEDVSCQSVSACNTLPRKSKDEIPMRIYEVEEVLEPIIEDQPHQTKFLGSGQSSPICGSPNSPRLSFVDWDDFPSFTLKESPTRLISDSPRLDLEDFSSFTPAMS